MSEKRRILIVDDEPKVGIVLANSLRKMGSYEVDTANSGKAALTRLTETAYDLVLTDYKMPGLSGAELSQVIRSRFPTVQIVLMTAYGTANLQQRLQQLGAQGYIEKPFKLVQLRQVINQTLKKAPPPSPAPPPPETALAPQEVPLPKIPVYFSDKGFQRVLQKLQRNVNAICVLLLNASGYPVETSGSTEGIDINSLSALSAANCSVFKSNYHEGSQFNVYSYDVNGELFVSVFFGAQTKPGIVWFYTKQAAETLAEMANANVAENDQFAPPQLDADFVEALTGAMDDTFAEFLTESPAAPAPPAADPDPPASRSSASSTRSLSYEDAIKAGLVPEHILERQTKSTHGGQ